MARILHIEDDPGNRLLVRKLLQTAGHIVTEAVDGLEGVKLACAERPDLVLVDLNLPGLDGYEVTILVDATPRGDAPGTIYTIEPDLSELDELPVEDQIVETHGMNPMKVLAMVKSMGGTFGKVLLIGCEPTPLQSEDGELGLSKPVELAVDKAVSMIENMVNEMLAARSREAAA